MILDGQNLFEPLTGTAITSSAASTNVIDLSVERDMGVGSPSLKLLVVTGAAAFTAAGAATLNIQFQGAPDNGSGGQGTYVTLAESGTIAKALLTASTLLFSIDVPRYFPTNWKLAPNDESSSSLMPRFYRLNYVVATGPFTAGSLIAGLALDVETPIFFTPGIVVAN